MSELRLDLRHVSFEGRPTSSFRRASTGRATDGANASARASAAAPDDRPAEGFPAWVLARAGMDARAYRDRPLQRRMPACLRALRCADEAAARRRVQEQPAALALALSHLLIGVTEPFRDVSVFEAVRRRVLPGLAARPRLRVWSAGCASGAELVGIAALLAEAGLLERSALLGTDCRAEAVAAAESSEWPDAAFPPTFRPLRTAFFEPLEGGGWRPREPLRSRLTWKRADATVAVEEGPWDLVLWRNVAIYLTAEASGRLAGRIAETLAPGGYLVVGKAERPRHASLAPVERCVFRKEGGVAG